MLSEIRREKNTVWYKDIGIQFRVKHDGDNAIVWVNVNGYNTVKPMLLWDFFLDMEECGIELKINDSWNEHAGFQVNKDEVLLLIGLIEGFFYNKDTSSLLLSEEFPDWDNEI